MMSAPHAAFWMFLGIFVSGLWSYRQGKIAGLSAQSLANTTLVFELRAQGKITMGEAKSLLSQPDDSWWWS